MQLTKSQQKGLDKTVYTLVGIGFTLGTIATILNKEIIGYLIVIGIGCIPVITIMLVGIILKSK